MRFDFLGYLSLSTLVVLAFAQDSGASDANALLQSLATLPDCAVSQDIGWQGIPFLLTLSHKQTCIAAALPAATDCALGDLACLCASDPFTASSGACVLANCTIKGALRS